MSKVETTTTKQPTSSRNHALASQLAGTLSNIVFNPLEVVRMRFMSQDGTSHRTHQGVRYVSTAQALRDMYSKEGGIRVFFRGAHVAALASGFAHGVYMYSYRSLLDVCSSSSSTTVDRLPFSTTFACSVGANTIVAYTTNPVWFIKTRMQLADAGKSKVSAITCATQALKNEGPLVFWRGCSAQILLAVPSSLHLPIYELLLRWSGAPLNRMQTSADRVEQQKQQQKSKSGFIVSSVVACNVVAKTFVTVLCHPFTLLRTRLMDSRARTGDEVRYNTLRDVVRYLSTNSSSAVQPQLQFSGLFRGLAPSLMQIVPRSVVHIALYEFFVNSLIA